MTALNLSAEDAAARDRLVAHLRALVPDGCASVTVVEAGDEYEAGAKIAARQTSWRFSRGVSARARGGTPGDALCECARLLGVAL